MEISTNKKRRNDGEYLEGSKPRINHRFGAPIHKILWALGRGLSGAAGVEKGKCEGLWRENRGHSVLLRQGAWRPGLGRHGAMPCQRGKSPLTSMAPLTGALCYLAWRPGCGRHAYRAIL